MNNYFYGCRLKQLCILIKKCFTVNGYMVQWLQKDAVKNVRCY